MQRCHISQNLKNLNLVPDSFARLLWVIFYIYTLVMAGYCIVLIPLATCACVSVPVLSVLACYCGPIITRGLTLTSEGWLVRILISHHQQAQTWPELFILNWNSRLSGEEWGLLTFDLNCASQPLLRAWRSIQPELVTPNDSCWQQSRFQLFVSPGSNVWNSSYWAICGWVMVSDCTNNGWTNWFNAE